LREEQSTLMSAARVRITGARITPVAFVDPPLLNTVGVHQPFALRAIIQLDTDAGLVGLGETYADVVHLARLKAAANAITGLDVFALNAIRAAISDRLGGDSTGDGSGLAGMITSASVVDRVFSPFEVACLDDRFPTCSAARSATRCRSVRICSTSGPRTPAPRPTSGVRHSIRRASSRKPNG
jgi:hypothetical protein